MVLFAPLFHPRPLFNGISFGIGAFCLFLLLIYHSYKSFCQKKKQSPSKDAESSNQPSEERASITKSESNRVKRDQKEYSCLDQLYACNPMTRDKIHGPSRQVRIHLTTVIIYSSPHINRNVYYFGPKSMHLL